MEKANETMQGDFVGIGVSFYMYKDTLSVIRPLEGGPSIEGRHTTGRQDPHG